MPHRSQRRVWRAASPCVPLTLLLFAALSPPTLATPTVSTVKAVQAVAVRGQAANYDITLYSTKEFPMRDDVITLTIGNKTFLNSRYLQNGTLHTIVFRLTQREYQSVKNGDAMSVSFGQANPADSTARWDFGRFRKPVTGGLR